MLARLLSLVLLCCASTSSIASAHEITTSVFDVELAPGQVNITLGAHAHLVDLAVAADVDRDGHLTQRELDDAQQSLATYLDARLHVRSGAACVRTALSATPTERGGARIVLRFICTRPCRPATAVRRVAPATGGDALAGEEAGDAITCNSNDPGSRGQPAGPLRTFDIDNDVFFDLVPKHTFIGVLTTNFDGVAQRYQLAFDSGHRHLHHAAAGPPPLPVASTSSVIGAYLVLGVEHILGGFDHLVFVFTIIVVARRLRDVAWLVSAFTLAHSVTLTLAALDVVTLPSSFIEPAIALSILAVAVLNLSGHAHPHPWIVFAFGLLHGFGFAGALAETGLPTSDVAWALGAFNVGVELGQLAVVLVVWPLVLLVARRPSWYRAFVLASSLIVSVLALVWFIERIA